MAASGFFKDAQTEAAAAVKIMAGMEYGFDIVQSMAGVHIIEGKPSLSAHLQAAALRRSGAYDYEVADLTDERCLIRFFRIRGQNRAEIGTSEFTLDDADRAGLLRGANWQKYPRNMLFARAMTNGIGWHCPDAFGGRVYDPSELLDDDAVDAEGGIVDVSLVAPQAPPRAASRPPRSTQRRASTDAPAEAATGAEARSGAAEGIEAIRNVGNLMTWAQNTGKRLNVTVDGKIVASILNVPNVKAIADQFPSEEQLQGAARLILRHLQPSDPAADLEALTPEQMAIYTDHVTEGMGHDDALALATAEPFPEDGATEEIPEEPAPADAPTEEAPEEVSGDDGDSPE